MEEFPHSGSQESDHDEEMVDWMSQSQLPFTLTQGQEHGMELEVEEGGGGEETTHDSIDAEPRGNLMVNDAASAGASTVYDNEDSECDVNARISDTNVTLGCV